EVADGISKVGSILCFCGIIPFGLSHNGMTACGAQLLRLVSAKPRRGAGTAGRRRWKASRHRMERPEATTIAEPTSRPRVGTSPHTAKARIVAHTSDR